MRRLVVTPAYETDVHSGTTLTLANSGVPAFLLLKMEEKNKPILLTRINSSQARVLAARLISGADELDKHFLPEETETI